MVDEQPAKISRVKDDLRDAVPVVVLVPWGREARLDHSREPGAGSPFAKPLHFEASVDALHQPGSTWLSVNQVARR